MDVAAPVRENVILVGCELKRPVSPATGRGAGLSLEESLDELAALASAARARVAARLLQQRSRYDPAYLIGKGKVEGLKGLLDRHGAGTVIFDDNETSSAHSTARWSTEPSSSWTSLPAVREPGKGSCRSNWPSSTTGCLDWGDGEWSCPAWAEESGRAGRVRPSWRRISARSTRGFTRSNAISSG